MEYGGDTTLVALVFSVFWCRPAATTSCVRCSSRRRCWRMPDRCSWWWCEPPGHRTGYPQSRETRGKGLQNGECLVFCLWCQYHRPLSRLYETWVNWLPLSLSRGFCVKIRSLNRKTGRAWWPHLSNYQTLHLMPPTSTAAAAASSSCSCGSVWKLIKLTPIQIIVHRSFSKMSTARVDQDKTR